MKTNLDTSTEHPMNNPTTLASEELSGVGGGWGGNTGWAGGWCGNNGGRGGREQGYLDNRGCTNSRSYCGDDPFGRGGYASSSTTFSWR